MLSQVSQQLVKTPVKGRPKKGKAFRGTPKKIDRRDYGVSPSSQVRDPNAPLGLLNLAENVCFFNSVVQVLYAIPAFRNLVQELVPDDNQAIIAIKHMFQEISNSNEPVRTSGYVQLLGLPNYIFGRQYDAHECLLEFLDRIYPIITNDCMFKVSMLESVACNRNDCDKQLDTSAIGYDIELIVEDDPTVTQTVTGILSNVENYRELLKGYQCDKCKTWNTSMKRDSISQTSDILILTLKLFKTVDDFGTTVKIIPNLNIQDELSL